MLDRTIAPGFKKVNKVNLRKAVSTQLGNGVPLHVINAGTQPVVKLEVVLNSGKWFEKKDGQSFFCCKMLSEGTTNHSAEEISERFDRYGSFLELIPGYDYNSIGLYALTKHFPEVLPFFREIILESAFPEQEFSILRNNTISELKVKNQRINVVASRRFRELIFGTDHPYGRELTEEHVNALNGPGELRDFYRKTFLNRPEVICVGNVEDREIDLINKYLGDFTPADFDAPKVERPEYNSRKETIGKPESFQSSIRLGMPFLSKKDPDYLKILVVNEVLGGYFGSRLMKNIREEKGYTYGIYSRLMNFKNEGYFLISADVKKEFTNQTIEEIYKEINILRTDLVPEDELQTVKNQMIGGFLSEIASPFMLADKFKAVRFHGMDYRFYDEFISAVNDITSEEIRRLSQKHLDPESISEVVVGGR